MHSVKKKKIVFFFFHLIFLNIGSACRTFASLFNIKIALLLFFLQVAEEEYLIQELRKIENRKKEREKKAQDLQKLIKAADTTTELRRAEKRVSKKKLPQKRETEKPVRCMILKASSKEQDNHLYLRNIYQQIKA